MTRIRTPVHVDISSSYWWSNHALTRYCVARTFLSLSDVSEGYRCSLYWPQSAWRRCLHAVRPARYVRSDYYISFESPCSYCGPSCRGCRSCERCRLIEARCTSSSSNGTAADRERCGDRRPASAQSRAIDLSSSMVCPGVRVVALPICVRARPCDSGATTEPAGVKVLSGCMYA